jgi:hypothetical protein
MSKQTQAEIDQMIQRARVKEKQSNSIFFKLIVLNFHSQQIVI